MPISPTSSRDGTRRQPSSPLPAADVQLRASVLNERLVTRVERLEAFIAETGQTAAWHAWLAALPDRAER